MFIILLIFIVVFIVTFVSVKNQKDKTSFWDSTYGEPSEEARRQYGGGIQYRPIVNPNPKKAEPTPVKEPEFMAFELKGTTLKDDGISRQTTLRRLKAKEAPFNTGATSIEFIQTTLDDGEVTVSVTGNGRILGTVPDARVDEFIDRIESNENYDVVYDVTGGGEKPYGCKITVTWED